MKKAILGLIIAIVATTSGIYVSASNKAGSRKIWGSTSSNMYVRIWDNNYDPGNCLAITDGPCVYRLLRINGPEYVPDYLLSWQIDTWVDKGYLEPIGQGMYAW